MKFSEIILTIIKSMPIGLITLLIIDSFEPINLIVNWLLFILFISIFVYLIRITKNQKKNIAFLLQFTMHGLLPFLILL